MRWLAIPRLLLLLAGAAACGPQPATPMPTPAAITFTIPPPWPACAPSINNPPPVPSNFAPGFPLPPGLLLTKALVLHNDPNNIEIVGFAPLVLPEAILWLRERPPQSGYIAVQTDAEADEVEGSIAGNGWDGNYWVKPEMTCTAVTEWVLIVRKRG